jgi:O-acetyl-ADP-ribose deacetylase (regulator of RNase III)
MLAIQGNLLESDERVIAHGCNTWGLMGAGFALQVKRKYPFVHECYETECHEKRFVAGSALPVWFDQRIIFNLGTQIKPGAEAKEWFITLAFANMAERCSRLGIDRVAIPAIGCGIGGLVWADVERAIEAGMANARARGAAPEVVLYQFDPITL